MTRTRALLGIAACAAIATVTASAAGHAVPRGSSAGLTPVYSWGVVGSGGKLTQLQHDTPIRVPGVPGVVVQIATSNSDSYALTADGRVWAWGVGSRGELGNGSTAAFSTTAVPVAFPPGVRIASLPNPTPFDAGLAIDTRGRAWGWGLNTSHDLCLTSPLIVLRPTRLPFAHVTLATGAGTHALFDSLGKVYGCGDGGQGQLGNGAFANRATPTRVVGLPAGPVQALTSSFQGSGALMASGAYYDWGLNTSGQLGNGKRTNSAVPVRVALRAPVTQVSQGGSQKANGQTLAILADRSLWVWGSGAWGQIGNGRTADALRPVPLTLPHGARAAQVSSGGYACYVIDSSGRLWAWGRNNAGQLGTGGSAPMELRPVAVGLSLTQVSSTATNVAGFAGGSG
jgi:alpha-tubulin suppressor-like RCC1 family protein